MQFKYYFYFKESIFNYYLYDILSNVKCKNFQAKMCECEKLFLYSEENIIQAKILLDFFFSHLVS